MHLEHQISLSKTPAQKWTTEKQTEEHEPDNNIIQESVEEIRKGLSNIARELPDPQHEWYRRFLEGALKCSDQPEIPIER